MEFTTSQIVLGVVLPLVWSAMAWGVGWRIGGAWRRLAGVTAVGGAFLIGFWASEPVGPWPPVESGQWLFWAAIGVVVVGLVAAGVGDGLAQAVGAALAGALVVGLVLTGWRARADWLGTPLHTPADAWTRTGVAMAGAAVFAWLAGQLARFPARGDRGSLAGVWVMGGVAAMTAVVLGMSGSQATAPLRAGALGLAMLPAVVVGWTDRGFRAGGMTGVVWGVLLVGMWLTGRFYFSMTALNGWLLAAGPALAGAVSMVPVASRGRPWVRTAVLTGVGIAPGAVALGLAAMKFAHDMSETPVE